MPKARDNAETCADTEPVTSLPRVELPSVYELVPLHSDFDRLTVPWFQCGQVGTINQDSDTPGHPRAP